MTPILIQPQLFSSGTLMAYCRVGTLHEGSLLQFRGRSYVVYFVSESVDPSLGRDLVHISCRPEGED